jgi:hypothetical protein
VEEGFWLVDELNRAGLGDNTPDNRHERADAVALNFKLVELLDLFRIRE